MPLTGEINLEFASLAPLYGDIAHSLLHPTRRSNSIPRPARRRVLVIRRAGLKKGFWEALHVTSCCSSTTAPHCSSDACCRQHPVPRVVPVVQQNIQNPCFIDDIDCILYDGNDRITDDDIDHIIYNNNVSINSASLF
ncbi:unknown protein [Oryza sativa Japonica Group]|uniref:Uncharacterized protein n=1 Tax=Oryza sativa subsp. japonica TaxID=39947 RepID=Q8S0B8_ORYSJ|nr:unknown protein [Oryza sativa Japonica Group]